MCALGNRQPRAPRPRPRRRQAAGRPGASGRGRSGFGGEAPGGDPYTRLEWQTFMRHPSASDDCLVYWEHWRDGDAVHEEPIASLAERITVVLRANAEPCRVSGDFFGPEQGVAIEGPVCFNFQFQRRRHAV